MRARERRIDVEKARERESEKNERGIEYKVTENQRERGNRE